MLEIDDYRWLVTDAAAQNTLAKLGRDSAPLHRQLAALRRSYSAERATLLVEQAGLRTKAAEKFGELADKMYFTDRALQQATDLCLARYKAARFSPRGLREDLCCGVGGDLLALAREGTAVGWESDPAVALLAGANLRVTGSPTSRVEFGDVEQREPASSVEWHVDPDRRVGGKRSTQPQFHSPKAETLTRWLKIAPNGAIKLAPASVIESGWEEQGELEWISHRRECKQLVAWFGRLARSPGERRATKVLTTDHAAEVIEFVTFCGVPNDDAPICVSVEDYVFDLDPALRAARVADSFGNSHELARIAEHGGYFTSSRALQHGLCQVFRVQEILPYRLKTVAEYLKAHGVGHLEIKTSGVEHRPEVLRRQLKPQGPDQATLLVTRFGKKEIAILAQRVEPAP